MCVVRGLAIQDERGRARKGTRLSLFLIADALGMQTVVEGVEIAEQAAALQTFGCGTAQGYLCGRTVDLGDFN